MEKAKLLRKLLKREGPVLIAGAHNGLSARIVEEAGFDAIWASGFEISATYAVPDANILTSVETLAAAKSINGGCGIPVVADCDNGFGNAINVIRTVREYEMAGIAGMCIEDNIFPKRCSFYAGVRRELESVEEFAGKVRAAKGAQTSADFVVIARTEALIAGWGMEEALTRARAYADAGADMVLIHSKSEGPEEVRRFAQLWDRKVPLVCVPTTYKSVTAPELHAWGFKAVIFANHAVRSAIKAMQETMKEMRAAQSTGAIDHRVVPLKEVYRLVGVNQLQTDEAQYLPAGGEPVRAIIIAAGRSEALGPLTADRPKAMLDVKGKTILERQVEALNAVGVKDIVVVRGYHSEAVDLPNIKYYENRDFENSSEVDSFFRAYEEMNCRVLFLYGDIMFEKGIAEKLLKNDKDVAVVLDRSYADASAEAKNGGRRHDLVRMASDPGPTHRFMDFEDGSTNTVKAIGRNLEDKDAHGEFIGMAMFSKKGCDLAKQTFKRCLRDFEGKKFHEAETFKKAAMTDFVQELTTTGTPVGAVEIYKGWMEINTFEDYRRAWAQTA